MAQENFSVALISQGKHKFYSLTMPIEVIAESCSPNPRAIDPEDGFQRTLEEPRAESIAEYIRTGGVIPSSIILSAQPESQFSYNSKNKTITFEVSSKSFLILDGQHRVYGFRKLLNEGIKYRIPVVIFNELTAVEEARLFIDINTLQRPVPKELLLDIKRLAERESNDELLLDELFTNFETESGSYLINKLSRIEKQKGKISKVTFYDSMKPILKEFNITNTTRLFKIINSYLLAAHDISSENGFDLGESITKATVFKILLSHSKSIVAMISDNNPEDLEKISEHKRYLTRSLPSSFNEISSSKSYLKAVDYLDKKLLKKNVTI